VACGRWRGCIAKFGYVRYVCVNGRVKGTDRKWATIKTGKVVLLATTCSEVSESARDFVLGGGFQHSGSYPLVFQHSGARDFDLGEGFNTQVVMVFQQ